MYKVLIADDEMIIRKGLKSFVEREEGFCVSALCEDGQEALSMAMEDKPDVCFVDINMPFVNGLEFIERFNRICPEACVVVVTGYDDFAYAQQAIRLHVRDYLLKPVNEEDFRETMEKVRGILDAKKLSRRISDWRGESDVKLKRMEDNRPSYSEKIRAALSYLNGNYGDAELTLNETAAYLHVSAPYLSKTFREETGDTFQGYLQRIRLKKAAELLKDEEIMIYEIAERCGYSSQHYFSAAFKKETGMSPAEYRRGLRPS